MMVSDVSSSHVGFEGGIFLGETVQGLGHIDLGLVVFRQYGQGYYRIRHEHGGHGQAEFSET